MLKAGLVSISFRSKSPDEIISAAKSAGLDTIEWGSDGHAPFYDTERLRYIAEKQKAAGIKSCTYGTYFRIGVNYWGEIYAYIAAAKILGAGILRVWCGNKASMDYSEAEEQKLISDSRRIAAAAENEGVTVCLEFHPHTFSDEMKSSLRLIKAVGSPAFKMYWQPNQFKTVEENMLSAAGLAEYVENIHVFNWDAHRRYPLGEGIDIWRKYAACFKGEHTMMLEFMPDDDIDSLTEEARALRDIITG